MATWKENNTLLKYRKLKEDRDFAKSLKGFEDLVADVWNDVKYVRKVSAYIERLMSFLNKAKEVEPYSGHGQPAFKFELDCTLDGYYDEYQGTPIGELDEETFHDWEHILDDNSIPAALKLKWLLLKWAPEGKDDQAKPRAEILQPCIHVYTPAVWEHKRIYSLGFCQNCENWLEQWDTEKNPEVEEDYPGVDGNPYSGILVFKPYSLQDLKGITQWCSEHWDELEDLWNTAATENNDI